MSASRPPISPKSSHPPIPRGSRSPLPENSLSPHKEKKRILVVDDKFSDTLLVRACLEQTNDYVVREENNAKSALASALEFRPHLILLDVRMPGIDGCELAACFQATAKLRNVPIVFLTALVTKKEVEAGSGWMGRYPLLAKPIILADLIAGVKLHLGG